VKCQRRSAKSLPAMQHTAQTAKWSAELNTAIASITIGSSCKVFFAPVEKEQRKRVGPRQQGLCFCCYLGPVPHLYSKSKLT
jgi:DUF1680 family protein